jgi:hypothetical protein
MKTIQLKQVKTYLETNFQHKVILLKDLQLHFKYIKQGNLRQILHRLVLNGTLSLPYQRKGAYLLASNTANSFPLEKILISKYVYNEKQERIGFLGGMNYVNALRLTTQTSPVIYVFSKRLSHPKRMVHFGQYRVMLIKLPSSLDLSQLELVKVMTHLPLIDKMSEISRVKTIHRIKEFLLEQKLHLNKTSIDDLIHRLPLPLRLKAYEYELNQLITT